MELYPHVAIISQACNVCSGPLSPLALDADWALVARSLWERAVVLQPQLPGCSSFLPPPLSAPSVRAAMGEHGGEFSLAETTFCHVHV